VFKSMKLTLVYLVMSPLLRRNISADCINVIIFKSCNYHRFQYLFMESAMGINIHPIDHLLDYIHTSWMKEGYIDGR
jgi:hypothetical protein